MPAPRSARSAASHLVSFLDNHDVPRFLGEAPAGLAPDELAKRYTIALTLLFTLPEIPQVYQGDELGMTGDGAHNRADMPAWSWDAGARAGMHAGFVGDAQATWALVQSLAKLRAGEEALWRGTYVELRRQTGDGNVFAFLRATADGKSRVLVVVSDDPAPRTVTLPLPAATAWPEGTVLKDAAGLGAPPTAQVTRGAVTLALPPLTAAIYREAR